MSELAKALAAFQADLPHVAKDAAAVVPTKAGGAFGYRYADLADVTAVVLPALAKHGLAFTALPSWGNAAADPGQDRFVLAYSLLHESGEKLDGFYPLPESGTPQQIGSAITYARRYCLCAVTGVAPDDDDDDGEAAEQAPPPKRTRTRIPGPDHERLRQDAAQGRVPGTERSRGPAPADEKWEVRDAPEEPPEDQPGSILPEDRTHIMKLCAKLDRDTRLATLARIVGHPVETANDLSAVEAKQVIAELEAGK